MFRVKSTRFRRKNDFLIKVLFKHFLATTNYLFRVVPMDNTNVLVASLTLSRSCGGTIGSSMALMKTMGLSMPCQQWMQDIFVYISSRDSQPSSFLKNEKKIYLLILVFQFLSQISTSFAKPTMSFKNIIKLKAKVRLSLNVLFAFKTTVKLY